MAMFSGILCFVGSLILLVMAIVAIVRKSGKAKQYFLISGGLFVLFVVMAVVSPPSDVSDNKLAAEAPEANSPSPSKTSTSDESAGVESENTAAAQSEARAAEEAREAEEARLAEEARKAEEARLAEEEAKRKENIIDGNGMFAVNSEIKPGLYRAESGITYWARLSGFSGELNDLIANGLPSGSVVVEILESDKGFETMGFGEWALVDENYNPTVATEFSDGIYIVGKDIAPGTYKTDGGVTYWARLSSFRGDMSALIANGLPDGPTIVEISSSDAGFETVGGGTWSIVE